MKDYEDNAVWRTFVGKAKARHEAMVRELLEYASDLLNAVDETFPTYTLHTSVHAANVARLMGHLLGDRCDDLTELEAAMLLLAAYWHDTGMVFDAAAREALRHEPEFDRFLADIPEAFIAVHEAAGELPRAIAEWYCRWRHADRVYVHLDRVEREDPKALTWDVVRLRDELGDVCRSHNLLARQLHDPVFDTNFNAECDLRMCAILLRLADIMDFDRSRSPVALHRHLNLDDAGSATKAASAREWNKHHSSAGFRFPKPRPREPYALDFVAGPDDPAIEHDLRGFLDVIESELRDSAVLLRSCSERWRDLVLPDRIKRDQIRSQGYKYGEHRFTLDRESVLRLFMGENLYESPYAFIREILQNALDASRHREFHERATGRADFRAAPIVVSEWRDRDNHRWVQIEDFGMGMTEAILTDYFLMVGRSYYQSDAFRAEVLREARGDDQFRPISRFGVGILSCFVTGDQLHVSTKHVDGSPPLRLSLSSLEGYYALQVGWRMAATPMPDPSGRGVDGYRREPGTTIAVRMDPRKESGPFDLRALLEEHVFCPPVPVEHDGEAIGGTLERLGHPRCAYFEHGLEPEKVAQLEDGLGMALPDGVRLHAVPLNLTEMTPAGEFRGQAAAAFVTLGGRRLQSVGPRAERSLTVRADGDELVLLCEFHFPRRSDDPLRDELAMLEDPRFDSVDDEYVRGRIRRLRLAGERLARDPERAFPGTWRHGPRSRHSFAGNIREYGDQWEREATIATGVRVSEMLDPRDGLRWSHNGIRIPTRYRRRREGVTARVDLGHLVSRDGVDALWSADIGLSDRLRPDLVVSRDELHGLPWQIHSAAGLALRRAARADGRGLLDASDSQMFAGPSFVEGVLLGDVADDPLLTQPDGWKAEALFAGMSIEEIVSLAEHGQPQQVQLPSPDDLLAPQYSPPSFLAICRAAVVALNADIRWLSENPDTVWGWQCVVVPRSAPLVRALRLFPPLFSAEYIGSDRLKLGDGPVNRDHRFTVWLLDAAEELTRMYPGLLAAIRSDLCRHRYNEDMTKKAEGINAAVDRLRELNPGLAPPRSLKVAADDFA